jgi:hypothetical protein
MNEEKTHNTVPLTYHGDVVGSAKVYSDGRIEATFHDDTPMDVLNAVGVGSLSIGTDLEGAVEAALISSNPLLNPKYVDDGPTEDLSDMAFTKTIRGGAKVNREGPRSFKTEDPEVTQPMSQALGVVLAYYNEMWRTEDTPITSAEVRLVWFSKTLENWKAMVITTLDDKYYFEVTHSGARKKTFVDVYEKIDNVELDDETWIDGNS